VLKLAVEGVLGLVPLEALDAQERVVPLQRLLVPLPPLVERPRLKGGGAEGRGGVMGGGGSQGSERSHALCKSRTASLLRALGIRTQRPSWCSRSNKRRIWGMQPLVHKLVPVADLDAWWKSRGDGRLDDTLSLGQEVGEERWGVCVCV